MSWAIKSEIENLICQQGSDGLEHSFAGSFTASIYDTAWIACIQKDGRWLYPRSFEYIVQRQLASGLWHSGCSTSDILNGLGGLFALLQHAEQGHDSDDILTRARRAGDALRDALQLWDVNSADGVGFEVLIPSMLDLLARKSLVFEFPGKETLLNLYNTRMSKLPFEVVYERGGVVLHSAEVFYGATDFDFDRLQKHKIQGSIMASPSASAAYLMRSSSWDDETQAYIERALDDVSSGSKHSVASAYPTMTFELTWAMTTLVDQGWDRGELPKGLDREVLKTLSASGALDNNCVGFINGVQPDLDDTAKSSIALNLLGRPGLSRKMIKAFDAGTHCKTYDGERNASPSANCNALYALLLDAAEWDDCRGVWREKVNMLVTYLTSVYWTAHDDPLDKWNHSPWYSLMLLTRSFTEVMASATVEPATKLSNKVTLLLSRCLVKALSEQDPNGSWGRMGKCEETAYVVLLLSLIQRTGLFPGAVDEVSLSIAKAQDFLELETHTPEALWIEKVDYGSGLVSRCYVLAALGTAVPQSPPAIFEGTPGCGEHVLKIQERTKKVLKQLPLLQDCQDWLVDLSGAEAQLYHQSLRDVYSAVVVRQGYTEDKYLAIIPLIWTMANNICGTKMSCEFLRQMMVVSLLDFQIDEFMESAVGGCENDKAVEDYIQNGLFRDDEVDEANDLNGAGLTRATLRRFRDYTMRHTQVVTSSRQDQITLKMELKKFLLAHMAQNKDNRSIRQHRHSGSTGPYIPSKDFKPWLRGTASIHTSCAYSFAFAVCLLGNGNKGDVFPSLEERYVADDLVQHLAAMCRLFNDIGSVARDRDDCNLNCADFEQVKGYRDDSNDDSAKKLKLLALGEHERSMVETCKGRLQSICDENAARMVDVFVAASDLFSQMYVVKDVSSRRLK